MLPEVEKYFEKRRSADTAYDTEYRKIRDGLYYEDRDAYYSRVKELDEARTELHREADGLLQNSENAVVQYIFSVIGNEYRNHSNLVLQLLPCSLDTLNAYAKDNNWCSTWNELVDDAVDAGVLPGVKVAPERRAFDRYLIRKVGVSNQAKNEINELVKTLIDAEITKATAELREDSEKLRALEAAGVDNWEGYSNALADRED